MKRFISLMFICGVLAGTGCRTYTTNRGGTVDEYNTTSGHYAEPAPSEPLRPDDINTYPLMPGIVPPAPPP